MVFKVSKYKKATTKIKLFIDVYRLKKNQDRFAFRIMNKDLKR